MSVLAVHEISQLYGDKRLKTDASFELFTGEHRGGVGQNGAGKSTLLKTLAGEVVPDKGYIRWQAKTKVGHLDQYAQVDESLTIFQYLRTAFRHLFAAEAKLKEVNRELQHNPDEKLIRTAASLQDTLERENFYGIDSQIQRVAAGLGLTAIGLDRPLGKLSGGQRAKTILAKLLLADSDVLLLDEPTNFLDREHIDWLIKFLKSFKGAFVIVSHDANFLNEVCTCILDIEFDTIKKYSGGYQGFLKQKEQQEAEYIRRYHSQQKEIERTEDYIAKNKTRASTANMAKSRQKKLDKMEKIAAPKFTAKPNIRFPFQSLTTRKALEVKALEVGYYYSLMPKLTFTMEMGQKWVFTGFNGIGKSTLLKTLIGELQPLAGSFSFGEKVKVNYYAQELEWEKPEITPMDYIFDLYPKMTVKEVRNALSRCVIRSDHAIQAIGTLSGGEQSKVKLCNLTLTPCNFLILDEPTNHLDATAQETLKKALINFEGAVILVSHDPNFYLDWADNIFDIEDHIILHD
ncbi:MAG: ABC-F family ATP-binding cassette domain-containing protein [Bacillota bacterium]|nr:ABC-F family ATP-binding cassette domain-containing protein [Bacillota bacterium]